MRKTIMNQAKLFCPALLLAILFLNIGCSEQNMSSKPINSSPAKSEVSNVKVGESNGRVDYGDSLRISGYDGIAFGTRLSDFPGCLSDIKGVNKGKDGNASFHKVPTKTYYCYYVDREEYSTKGQSEVAVFFKNGRVIQFRNVFGGDYNTNEEAMALYNSISEKLTKDWGDPEYSTSEKTTWVRDDVTAVLRADLIDSTRALPTVKLLVWTDQ